METAVLHTKIRPPGLRAGTVDRTRLLRHLDADKDSRLTVVCAPAGFGKSTLVGQWTARREGRFAWLSLDETDNDPVKFWKYMINAAEALCPDLTSRLMPLFSAMPNVSIYTILDAALAELAEAPAASLFVLDDYHMIAEPAIHDGMAYWIGHLPPNLRLVVASREELPPAMAIWSARGQRGDLDAKQLEFTREEAERLCRETFGLRLSDSAMSRLFERSEGWAAALQLMTLSLSSTADPEQALLGLGEQDRNLAPYLMNEIFGRLPEELKRFLLRTSILDRLDPELCAAASEEPESARVLEDLRRRRLFLIPLGEDGRQYRYHHLFAAFLRTEFERSEPAEYVRARRRAAEHLAGRGAFDEAIEHALTAGDDVFSVRLLEQHLYGVLQRGEFVTLLRWFGRLPEASLPVRFSQLRAFLQIVTGRPDLAEESVYRLELQTDRIEDAGSGLFFVKVNLAFATGNYAQWYAYADKLPHMLPESPLFYHFNYNTSESAVRRTVFGMKGAIPPEVEPISRRITAVMEEHGWGDSLFNLYILQTLAEGYYEWDRLEDARRLLDKVEPAARRKRVPGLWFPNRFAAARVCSAAGQAEKARRILEEAQASAETFDDPRWAELARLAALRLRLTTEPMTREAAAGLEFPIAGGQPSLYRIDEVLMQVRVLIARRRESEALRLLGRLSTLLERERDPGAASEAAVLEARLNDRIGRTAEADACIGRALDLGLPGGFVRVFVDEGEEAKKLLERYARQRPEAPSAREAEQQADQEAGQDERIAYAARLLKHFPAAEKELAPPKPLVRAAFIEPLSVREASLLRELMNGASNREIAERLFLSEGTVKVYLSRLYGKLGVSSRTQAMRAAAELDLPGNVREDR